MKCVQDGLTLKLHLLRIINAPLSSIFWHGHHRGDCAFVFHCPFTFWDWKSISRGAGILDAAPAVLVCQCCAAGVGLHSPFPITLIGLGYRYR